MRERITEYLSLDMRVLTDKISDGMQVIFWDIFRFDSGGNYSLHALFGYFLP